jgi:dTDP-4-dehydrorhamnose 3,5-epimerase
MSTESAVKLATSRNTELLTSELALPSCEKGVGPLIHSPDSPELVAGVRLEPYALWPDDRGYLLEVFRTGKGLVATYPSESTQVSASLSYPGTIKAFHYHVHQTDCWVPAMGMLQVALVDLRKDSKTFGVRNTLFLGVLRPWQIIIPPGVAHGYKAVGTEPAMLIYVTDRFYDPNDEGRVAYNDPRINYDWETRHR